MKRASTWLLLAAGLLVCAPAALAGPPDRYEVRTIVAGLEAPTALAYAPDGRLFVAEKTGRVTVFAKGRLHEFLDLSLGEPLLGPRAQQPRNRRARTSLSVLHRGTEDGRS